MLNMLCVYWIHICVCLLVTRWKHKPHLHNISTLHLACTGGFSSTVLFKQFDISNNDWLCPANLCGNMLVSRALPYAKKPKPKQKTKTLLWHMKTTTCIEKNREEHFVRLLLLLNGTRTALCDLASHNDNSFSVPGHLCSTTISVLLCAWNSIKGRRELSGCWSLCSGVKAHLYQDEIRQWSLSTLSYLGIQTLAGCQEAHV